MKKQIEQFNKLATEHKKTASYVIAGLLSLTIAFGLGQCTAPVDRQEICKTYINDKATLETQLSECRRTKVVDCDARIATCHKEEREACQVKLNEFREHCEALACQE